MVKGRQKLHKTDTRQVGGADPGEVGGRIRAARTHAVMSVLELSELSGVGRSTIAQLEAGATIPRPSTIRKISGVLNTSPQYLLTGLEAAVRAVENLRPAHERNEPHATRVAKRAIDEVLALIQDQREELISRLGDGFDRDNVDALSVTYQVQRMLMEKRHG